jgi:hypothetical protein
MIGFSMFHGLIGQVYLPECKFSEVDLKSLQRRKYFKYDFSKIRKSTKDK